MTKPISFKLDKNISYFFSKIILLFALKQKLLVSSDWDCVCHAGYGINFHPSLINQKVQLRRP